MFLGVAVLVALIAVFAGPSSSRQQGAEDLRGSDLYPDFDDVTAAARLEIVTFDKETGQPTTFAVARSETGWVIPTQGGYPADAKGQLGKALAAVHRLKIRDVIEGSSDKDAVRENKNLYGVVDPTVAKSSDKGP